MGNSNYNDKWIILSSMGNYSRNFNSNFKGFLEEMY